MGTMFHLFYIKFAMMCRLTADSCFLFDMEFFLTMQALLADFEVSEGIYSRALIEDTDSVCLWLGANVMLEYSCEEVQYAGNIFSLTF